MKQYHRLTPGTLLRGISSSVIGIQLLLHLKVSTTPLQIRILGEDLVIFKTTENKIGLVHKNCAHRRASLVYGKCEKKVFDVVIMDGYLHQMVKFLKRLAKILIQNQQLN